MSGGAFAICAPFPKRYARIARTRAGYVPNGHDQRSLGPAAVAACRPPYGSGPKQDCTGLLVLDDNPARLH